MVLTRVLSKKEIPNNTSKIININSKAIALFNIGGNFYAVDNSCKHRGGPVGEGEIHQEEVTCPWHGWVYNVKTGECLNVPGIRLQTYSVRVEGENILIDA